MNIPLETLERLAKLADTLWRERLRSDVLTHHEHIGELLHALVDLLAEARALDSVATTPGARLSDSGGLDALQESSEK